MTAISLEKAGKARNKPKIKGLRTRHWRLFLARFLRLPLSLMPNNLSHFFLIPAVLIDLMERFALN